MTGPRFHARAVVLALVTAAVAPAPPAAAQVIDPSDPAFWAGSGILLVTAWTLDGQLRRRDPTDRGGLSEDLAWLGYRLGGRGVVLPGFLSAAAVTHVTGWPTETSRVVRVAAGAAAAGVVVEAVKFTVGRGRPRDVGDPYQFRAFSRENAWLSFPSGHSAAAFSVAAALDREFDLRGFQVLGYGLATIVAWSRHYDDAHWASDTIAGAVIGVAAARSTVGWLQRVQGAAPPDVRIGVYDGAPMISVTIPTP